MKKRTSKRPPRNSPGERLVYLIDKQGLTVKEAADKYEISPSFLYDIRAGRCQPARNTLRNIAEIEKVPLEWLEGRDATDPSFLLPDDYADRLCDKIRLYKDSTRVLFNKHGKTLTQALEPVLAVFLDEEERLQKNNRREADDEDAG